MAGHAVGNRRVVNNRGSGKATSKSEGIIERFDGRARLAQGDCDIEIAVTGSVKIIFGANHGQNFTGYGISNQGGAIADTQKGHFRDFFGDGFLSGLLKWPIQGSNNVQTPLLYQIRAILLLQNFFDVHNEMRSFNVRGDGSEFEFLD